MSEKILVLDLETAPKLAHVWGLWNQNVGLNQLVQDTYVLNWSAIWLGDDYILSDALHYHKEFKKDPTNDRVIIESAWELLNEADYVVAHNGDRFDLPVLNSRFLAHGLQPPSTYKSIDTLKIARRNFKLTSNKLDFLARHLGLRGKIDTGGFKLWSDIVLNQDTDAFDKMVEYCEQDTKLLEQVYLALRPWDSKHPGTVLMTGLDKPRCNVCGSDHIVKNGSYSTNTQIYQKYKCMACGHNLRSRYAEKLSPDQKRNVLKSI